VPSVQTAVSYLTLCSGQEATTFEKDDYGASSARSTEFIAVTNHDAFSQSRDPYEHKAKELGDVLPGVQDMLQDSIERRRCLQENWRKLNGGRAELSDVSIHDVVDLVQKYPTTNKTTHFACVMDPQKGEMYWCRRWEKPIGEEWIIQHS